MIHETDLAVLQGLNCTLPVGGALTELEEITGLNKPTVSRVLKRLKTKYGLQLPLALDYSKLGLTLYASLTLINPRDYSSYQKAIQGFKPLSTYRLFGGEDFWFLSLYCMIPPQVHLFVKTLNSLRSWNWIRSFQIIPANKITSCLQPKRFDLTSQSWSIDNIKVEEVEYDTRETVALDLQDLKCLSYFQPDLLKPFQPLAKHEQISRLDIESRVKRLFKTVYYPQITVNYEEVGLTQVHFVWIQNAEAPQLYSLLKSLNMFPSNDIFLGKTEGGIVSILAILRNPVKDVEFYRSVLNKINNLKTHILFFETPNKATLLPPQAYPINLTPIESNGRIQWKEVASTQIL